MADTEEKWNTWDHPGFLGLTSEGLIVLHADWPAYPFGFGPTAALCDIGSFPANTPLHLIDEIDQCVLFLAGDFLPRPACFNETRFHVALWKADVVELTRLGLIWGASLFTEWEHVCAYYDYMKSLGGDFAQVQVPNRADYDTDAKTVLLYDDGGVRMSESGQQVLEDRLGREPLLTEIEERVGPLLKLGQYDTAVREACLAIEVRLRALTGSRQNGQKLIDEFASIVGQAGYLSAGVKILRSQLRTLFKFVRNEYAHNFKELGEVPCRAVLGRVSAVMQILQSLRLSQSEPAELP